MKKAAAVALDAATRDTVAVAKRSMAYEGANMDLFVTLTFDMPRTPGEYLIEAYAPDYDTVYMALNIDKIGSREYEKRIADLVFYRKTRKLDEVTVTASKVKFYNKGDTIVYNADAFQLAEGSMLDVLVKQLPGVEIKEGGRIYVNGKFIESLILNGKDFFKGNNNIMLDNLGAYTVRNIAVYDKWSERSMMAGRNLGDSEYVMDVRLKKEYMSGYTGNVEAGGGTSERYLARLFGMWYTTRSRVTLIGNINNLNDNRTPGQNDAWSAANVPGDMRTKMAGLDYSVNDDGKLWEFSGNTSVQHIRSNDITTVNKTNFLPDGDTYEKKVSNILNHNFDVKTDNKIIIRPKNGYISVGQNFFYRKNDSRSSALSGIFDTEARDLTKNLLEQIFAGEPTSFSGHTINTALTESLMYGHMLDASASIYGTLKPAHTPDLINLDINGGYKLNRYRMYDLYDVRYQDAQSHSLDYSYTKNAPDRSWNINISPSYEYAYSRSGTVAFVPKWRHEVTTKDSYLYNLDRLEDMGVFGALPDGYESTLDNDRTYYSTQTDDNVSVAIRNIWEKEFNNGQTLSYMINPIVTHRWRNLRYRQGEYDKPVNHNSTDIEVHNTYVRYQTKVGMFSLKYDRSAAVVPMNRLVDIVDSRDPLNIFSGSSKLRNSATNDITFEWSRFVSSRHRWSNILRAKYMIVENALTNSYVFDPKTGVRYFSMQNVNGNYNISVYNSFAKSFGPKNQFDLSSATTVSYGRSADLIGVSGYPLSKSNVHNLVLNQGLRLDWSIGKHKLYVIGRINWRDTHGEDAGFADFSATTAQYGAAMQLALPANFGLSTDINLYTRRGFVDKSLNTTDVVWNARLSYTIKKGRWMILLDGFDLLHQLSNVTYNVNAQGRTEMYTNVLPRYAMLHVQYRFMIQPRKK